MEYIDFSTDSHKTLEDIRHRYDNIILIATITLVILGVIMVYSSTSVLAYERYGDYFYFLKKHLLSAFIGMCIMVMGLKMDYHIWERLLPQLLFLSAGLLITVLISGLGYRVGGASRWLRISGFSFQPSELAKLSLVIYLASFIERKGKEVLASIKGFLPPLIICGIFFMLIVTEPDLGNALILVILTFVMLFSGGAKISHLSLMLFMGIPLFHLLISDVGYRRDRILGFLNPWADPEEKGFQLIQSFIAFGNGGLFGLGLGRSSQKLFFLPEIHTDFILSLIGEELGFVGVSFVLLLFLVLIGRGFLLVLKAKDHFGSYLALGITSLLSLHTLTNAGVVTGLLPTKGLPLPLLSYGGSSLILNLLGIGILLNISVSKKF